MSVPRGPSALGLWHRTPFRQPPAKHSLPSVSQLHHPAQPNTPDTARQYHCRGPSRCRFQTQRSCAKAAKWAKWRRRGVGKLGMAELAHHNRSTVPRRSDWRGFMLASRSCQSQTPRAVHKVPRTTRPSSRCQAWPSGLRPARPNPHPPGPTVAASLRCCVAVAWQFAYR